MPTRRPWVQVPSSAPCRGTQVGQGPCLQNRCSPVRSRPSTLAFPSLYAPDLIGTGARLLSELIAGSSPAGGAASSLRCRGSAHYATNVADLGSNPSGEANLPVLAERGTTLRRSLPRFDSWQEGRASGRQRLVIPCQGGDTGSNPVGASHVALSSSGQDAKKSPSAPSSSDAFSSRLLGARWLSYGRPGQFDSAIRDCIARQRSPTGRRRLTQDQDSGGSNPLVGTRGPRSPIGRRRPI